MSGLIFLLCCMLTVTWGEDSNSTTHANQLKTDVDAQTTFTTSFPSATNTPTSTPDTTRLTQRPSHPTSTHTPKTPAAPNDVPHGNLINTKDCLPILMVTGGLIIACAILLISTLMLTWKVCHLSRRLKGLASDDDLISSSDFWTGKSNKAKVKVETEDKEDTVLLGEVDQKQSDAKEDKKKKEEEEEKKAEEKKVEEKKEEEEKKLAGTVEESASTKPQENATGSPPAEPEAAATAD